LFTEISALRGDGIDVLLENILLQAELLELKANYEARAVGRVVESQVDLGRGIVATVMIQKGTLRTGDSFVAGVYSGKVRAMFDDRGERIAAATPAQPVQIVGLTGLPKAGDPFQATENEKTARQVGTKRQELKKVEEAQNITKVTLDNLYEQISEGDVQELKLIIKGDVHGSVEALRGALERLSTNEIKLSVIHSAAGAVNKDDVALASASNAIIIGFHIRATPNAQAMADREKVEIRKYDIIYEVIDDIRDAMEGLLAPEIVEDTIGTVEVRELFRISRVGTVAGSYVVSGAARRGATGQIVRDGRPLFRGRIVTLRRFKDDTREVDAGYECGIRIEGFNDVKVGDLIEVLEQRAVAKKLGAPTAELAAASGAGSPRTRSHVATPAQEG
jgi:translation initiation factor IF-2